MHSYGSDRNTSDVDVASAVELPLKRGRSLSFGGFSTTTVSGVPIDLVIRDDKYERLYLDAIDTAVKRPRMPLPVARPEEIIAMKMVAAREKDQNDIDFLLGTGAVDHDRARRIVGEYLGVYAADEYDRLVEVAEWLRERDKRRGR